jgi:hypothetical protein
MKTASLCRHWPVVVREHFNDVGPGGVFPKEPHADQTALDVDFDGADAPLLKGRNIDLAMLEEKIHVSDDLRPLRAGVRFGLPEQKLDAVANDLRALPKRCNDRLLFPQPLLSCPVGHGTTVFPANIQPAAYCGFRTH